MFHAIEDLARGWLETDGPGPSEMADLGLEGHDAKRTLVPKVWERLCKCVELVSPQPNSDKIIYWDQLGQVKVKYGDVNGARLAFQRAFELSEVVCGTAERSKGTRMVSWIREVQYTAVYIFFFFFFFFRIQMREGILASSWVQLYLDSLSLNKCILESIIHTLWFTL
jgi:hypothetical protein